MRRVLTCDHPERKHYAKGLCKACYSRESRKAKVVYATECPHPDRRVWARGLCSSCWREAKGRGDIQTPIKVFRRIGTCPHDDRPNRTRGLCNSCYSIDRNRGYFDVNPAVPKIDRMVEDLEAGLTIQEVCKEYDISPSRLKYRLRLRGEEELIPYAA